MHQDEKVIGTQPATQQTELHTDDILGALLDHKRGPEQPTAAQPPVPKELSAQDLLDLLTHEHGDGEGYTPE